MSIPIIYSLTSTKLPTAALLISQSNLLQHNHWHKPYIIPSNKPTLLLQLPTKNSQLTQQTIPTITIAPYSYVQALFKPYYYVQALFKPYSYVQALFKPCTHIKHFSSLSLMFEHLQTYHLNESNI
ncbi:hypothetical protein BY996DRAFT_6487961 [Phakopsora pachyrhizi]|nr:hypothetical protein BY996DRAFT_6487961 [Phakopsora pachyrhizi]